jgi:hypothetical protein
VCCRGNRFFNCCPNCGPRPSVVGRPGTSTRARGWPQCGRPWRRRPRSACSTTTTAWPPPPRRRRHCSSGAREER